MVIFSCLAQTAYAKTILVFGDSLSAGYGLEPHQAWPIQLAERWKTSTPQLKLVNASVSGETTQGGVIRLPSALRAHQPDLVLIELGANDGLRGYKIPSVRQNLELMIQKSIDSGATVVLAEIMIPPNYGPRYTQSFTRMYADLAQQFNIALMPFFLIDIAPNQQLMQPDGLHPNLAAQPKIADFIAPFLLANINE